MAMPAVLLGSLVVVTLAAWAHLPALPAMHRWPSPRSSRSAPLLLQAAPNPDGALFEQLIELSGSTSAVSLRKSDLGRSLVAAQDVAAGELLLSVPKGALLTAHRSGVVSGLVGQTDLVSEAVGDLRQEVGEEMFDRGTTWDVRLAVAVLEATAGAGGPFWDAYRRLLPLPLQLTHPICLPAEAQPELHDAALVDEARRRSELLARVYPPLMDHATHPATASYARSGAPLDQVPPPLSWAYALVVSRCFTMHDGDTFAFVPFLDMAQHSGDRPVANFSSDARGFTLRALRSVCEGEPITICYGEDYTSRRLFSQYGFAPAEGTAQDARLLREAVEEALSAGCDEVGAASGAPKMQPEAMLKAFEDAKRSSPYATTARLGALFDVLSDGDDPPAPRALLAAVAWKQGALPTTLDDDEATLLEYDRALVAGERRDPRLASILQYRIGRKRQLELARTVLVTYDAALAAADGDGDDASA